MMDYWRGNRLCQTRNEEEVQRVLAELAKPSKFSILISDLKKMVVKFWEAFQ
jgi:hypothetical protein